MMVRPQARNRAMLRIPFAFLLLAFTLLFCAAANALDEFKYDFRLARVLNEIQMYDYCELHLELMLKRYPDKRDRIHIEKARLLYARNRRAEGDKTIALIKKGSPFYAEALLLLGEMAYRRRDYEGAEEAYSQYFRLVKDPGDDPGVVEDYRKAIVIYSRMLEEQGKGKEAATVKGYLARIKGEAAASDRALILLKVQSLLAGEEEKFTTREPIDKKSIEAAIKQLESLQWVLDGVAAASFPETARAYILLEANEKAMDVLQASAEFLTTMEDTLEERGGGRGASPMAAALYYYGHAFKGKARDAFTKKDQGEARTSLIEAVKRFYRVVKDYGDSPYRTKALEEFSKCKNLLEEHFDTRIKMDLGSVSEELKLKMEQGQALLVAKNWDRALPIFLDGVRIGRRSRDMPSIAVRLVLCYGMLERYLEAQALCSYLAEAFPDVPDTGDALYRLGGIMYQAQRNEKDLARKNQLLAQALEVWEQFVTTAPAHERAAMTAFLIAEEQYREASEIAQLADSTKSTEENEAIKAQAREAYQQAVPKYLRLVDQFSRSDRAIRSLYKLGWIYYASEQPREAADVFLRYSESESDPKHADDRLEAKFRAAEQLMSSDSPAEATEHFTELIRWLEPGSDRAFDLNTKRAQQIREDSFSYLGWSYDLAGETHRPVLTGFRERIAEANREIRNAERLIAEAERRHKQAEGDIAKAREEFEERKQMLTVGLEERAKAAMEAAGKQADQIDEQASDEEKAMAKRLADERAKQMAAAMAQRNRERLRGERLGYEQEHENIKNETARVQDRGQKLAARLAEAQAKHDELTKERDRAVEQRKQFVDRMEAARRAVEDADAEVQKLQQLLDKARELQESEDVNEQRKGTIYRKEIATRLIEAQKKLNDAHVEKDAAITDTSEREVVRLQAQIEALQKQIDELEAVVRDQQHEKALADKDAELLQARLIAVATSLDRNRLESHQAPVEELKTVSANAAKAFQAVQDRKVEKAVLIQTQAKEATALANQSIEQARKRIEVVEVESKPVQAVFDEWKRKAATAFRDFLKRFPKSRHVPDNMARLGTIHLEFREFAKAAEILATLAKEHPKSRAGQQAFFNLGRAQFEIGQYEAAAAAFNEFLATPSQVLSANLVYVSENMLEAGRPEVSLSASKELTARSENRNHPDYELLRERTREPALYRAGLASFRLKDHQGALGFFQTLLDERPNTAFFFEVKFLMGQTRRLLEPPDFEGALADFSAVSVHAREPAMHNEAICRIAETHQMQGGRDDIRLALARYQQVAMLASPDDPDSLPWLEMGIYESAKCFALLGDTEGRDRMVRQYREQFPRGKYRQAINELPQAQFAPAPGTP